MLETGAYDAHFSLKNMLKDARYAQELAKEKGVAYEGGVRALVTDAGRMPVETLVVCAGVHSGEITAIKAANNPPIAADKSAAPNT